MAPRRVALRHPRVGQSDVRLREAGHQLDGALEAALGLAEPPETDQGLRGIEMQLKAVGPGPAQLVEARRALGELLLVEEVQPLAHQPAQRAGTPAILSFGSAPWATDPLAAPGLT